MPKVKLAVITLLAVVAIIIVIQNTQPVDTRILFATVTMPRAVLLLVTLAIGFVLGLLSSFVIAGRGKPKAS